MVTIIPTVDVEGAHGRHPFEQLVLGEVGEHESWGVFRLANIFKRFGVSATFFVDIYEYTLWGEKAIVPVCEKLLDLGQEVQLHTHPSWGDDPHDSDFFAIFEKRKKLFASKIGATAIIDLSLRQVGRFGSRKIRRY